MSKDLITIAIPIFNETGPAEKVVEQTYALPINKEIIVIDDGSTLPETLHILKKIKKKFPDIHFITNTPNIGKALSIQKAIHAAKGNVFVILDADYELDPKDILVLYKTLLTSGASLVNGFRVVKDHKDTQTVTNIFSRFSRWLLTLGTGLLYGFSVSDVLSGYKMFYTKMFKNHSFASKRFGLETEFIVETIRQGKKIIETNVNYYPRTYKEGKKINILDSIEILFVLFQRSALHQRFRPFIIPTLLFFMSFFIYMHTIKYYPTTDALPNTLVALNIIQEGRVDMENFAPHLQKKGLAGIMVLNEKGDHFPKTSVVGGLLSAPVLKVANMMMGVEYISPKEAVNQDYIYYAGKIVGAFYTALSVALFFVVLRKLYIHRLIGLVFTIVYAFGSQAYSIAAQANWQHGMSLFLLMIALYIIVLKPKRVATNIVLGGIIGIAAALRITNAFYILIPTSYIFLSFQNTKEKVKQISGLLGGGLFIVGAFLIVQHTFHIPGGYSDEFIFSLKIFSLPLFSQNIFAILFSYNMGLFFAFPILLVGAGALYILVKDRHPFGMSLLPTTLCFLFFSGFWWMWSGGYSPHARMLTEMSPLLVISSALIAHTYIRKQTFQIFFIALFLLSISTNLIYIYMSDTTWHDTYSKAGHREQLHNAWFHSPNFLTYHLRKQTISISHFFNKDSDIMSRDFVYRPSLQYKGIVTLFDGQHIILPHN